MDAVLICVPTPLDERREPDLSYVEETAKAIAPNLQRGQLIVLESTTYPGTTEELVLPILEKGGLHCPIAPAKGARMSRRIFIWRFLRSAKIPETSSTAWRRFRRSSAASILPAGGRRRDFTRRSSRRWFR